MAEVRIAFERAGRGVQLSQYFSTDAIIAAAETELQSVGRRAPATKTPCADLNSPPRTKVRPHNRPGKSIKITVPGKIASTKSYDLDAKDTTVNVAPGVKDGEWASVTENTDSNGYKTVTVKQSAGKRATHAKKN
jgi:hypothetical protein